MADPSPAAPTTPTPRRDTPLPRQLWRWWRLRSRRGLLITGALPSGPAADFVHRLKAGTVLPLPLDATRPDDADVVLIVGRVSLKLSLALQGLRDRLPPGALIVAIDEPVPSLYANAPAANTVDVDVVIDGLPPSPAAIEALVWRILPRRRSGGTP